MGLNADLHPLAKHISNLPLHERKIFAKAKSEQARNINYIAALLLGGLSIMAKQTYVDPPEKAAELMAYIDVEMGWLEEAMREFLELSAKWDGK